MIQILRRLLFFLLISFGGYSKLFGQCEPNNIEFKGVDKIYNTACGDVSYQDIRATTPSGYGLTYFWEVSFKGENYTVVRNGISPIVTAELAKSDITNHIIVPNSNASGDYRIRRVVSSTSGCSNSSEPVYLYYAQNAASLSGGTISGTTVTCISTSGTLSLSGHTGPILRWERAPVSTGIWEIIDNTTSAYTYTNLSESYCYRALVDNICDKNGTDLYSSVLCVTANSTPIVTTAPQSQSVCIGSSLNLSVTASSVLAPSYQWRRNGININGATLASLNIPTVDDTDAGSYDVVVNNDCGSATSAAAVITISPLPTATVPGNSTLCAGASTAETSFSSSPTGATYNWTNSNTGIGLAASGTGNVPAFTALNSGSTTISSTITVTPVLNGCAGPSSSYIITVKPLPVAIVPGSFSVCSGATVSSSSFSSLPAGATYTWTNSNTSIGLAASGNNNVPSFTAVNNTASPVSATISITPTLNGCTGTPSTYTITVNPLPVITSATPQNESNCDLSDGKITIVASGEAPLQYSIDGGATFSNGNLFENLEAGSYTVAVRSGYGCIVLGQTVTVASPGAPAPPVINDFLYPVCESSNLVLSVQNADESLVYTWTGPSQFSATGPIVTIPNVTPSNAGSYAVTATSGACVGTAQVFEVAVSPLPTVTVPPNLTFCEGSTIPEGVFLSTPAGATYTWTNSNTAIGLVSSGMNNIPSFTATNNTNAPITATITVIPTLNNCPGPAASFTITVNPRPAVILPADFAVCSGVSVPISNFSNNISGATYSWTNSNSSIGLASNGNGNLPAFSAVNNSNSPISSTITVTPYFDGCAGTSSSFTITVNPLPNVNVPANSIVCSGTSTPASSFSSGLPGTTFNWTNSNTSIGLSASGSGTVPAFIATNASSEIITANITVTPILNGCAGPSSVYSITVRPLPVITVPANIIACSGTTIPASIFSSIPAGSTYTWTNSNTAIGLAGSGIGNISAFTAINNTQSPITSTITVTPTNNVCTGPVSSFTITVNPLPVMAQPADLIVCAGVTIAASNFSSNVSGTTYSWTNSNPDIGLAAIGNGNIPSFAAINSTISAISATITVIPISNGCPGQPIIFTITVNPLPVILSAIATPESQCNIDDGTITITASGLQPLEYSINGGNTFVQNNGNFTNLAAGSYSIVVRNSSGCIITGPVLSVTSPSAPPQPEINAYVSPVCEGEPLILSIMNPNPMATYTWTGPSGFTASGASIIRSNSDPSMSGTYAVTATVNSCVSASKTFNIQVDPKPTLIAPMNQNYCKGNVVPEHIFNSTPPGATISWTNSNPAIGLPASGTGNIASFTAANNTNTAITASISVTPSLNGCPGQTYTYTITVNPLPLVTGPGNSVVCAGETISAGNLISNIPGTSYSWTNSNTAIGLPASGTGNIPSFIATNSSGTTISATITIIPSMNGCVGNTISYTIIVQPLPVITAALATNETACNLSNGIITITAVGTQPLEYSINGGITFVQNGGNFTGVRAGSYSVVVKNANGCLFIGPTLSVSSPGAPPQPDINPYVSPVCQGEPLILSILNPDPLFTYTWTGPMGFTETGQSVTRSNSNLSMSGTYAVTATLNSCVSVSKIFELKINQLPLLVVPENQIYCKGLTVPQSIFNSTPPGATISWTNSNPAIGLAASGSGNVPAFTAVNNTTEPITATITVILSLNGCIGLPNTYTITINPEPIVTVPLSFTICSGTLVSATSFGANIAGVTYKWTNSNPSIGLAASGNGNVPSFTAINNTSSAIQALITVFPTLNGCAAPSSSYIITIKPLPKLSNSSLTQMLCTQSSSKVVELTSNIPGTTFTWTASAPASVSGYATSGTNIIPVQFLTNSSSTPEFVTYTIIPGNNGCTGPESKYTIIVNPLPTATLSGGKMACFGAISTLSVKLTGKAPWTISYTDGFNSNTISGIGSSNYTFNVSSDTTRTYRITSVSDANSCSNSGSGGAIIIQPLAAIKASASIINVNCYGSNTGSIQIETVSGGFGTYEYSINRGISWQSGKIFNGLLAGSYQLYVRDAGSPECITVISPDYTISQPAAPLGLSFIRTDVSCFAGNNGSLKVTASGGTAPYIYRWQGGQITKDLNGLIAGSYSITITDSKGCEYTESIPIRQPAAPLKINFTKIDASCFGARDGSIDVSVSGGTSPYTYKWSNNESTKNLQNLAPNINYSLSVIDASGCSETISIPISEPEILKAALTVKNTVCKTSIDGMISATITGGTKPYDLTWKGSPIKNDILDNLAPGIYELFIKDARGCTLMVSAEVLRGSCPPIAIDDSFKTDEEIPVSGSVALNDYDRQGENISFSLTSAAKNGTITFSPDGKFNYTPNVGFWGLEIITYRVCNTSGMCATASLIIEVIPFTIVSLAPAISHVSEGKKTAVTARLMRPFRDDVTIRINYQGRAKNDLDYILLDQYLDIKIPRGKTFTTQKVTLAALTDDEQEGDEDVILSILSTSDPLVRIGNGATVIINDIYPPSPTIPITTKNDPPLNPDIIPDPLVSPNNDGLGNEFFRVENIVSFPDNEVLIFNRWGNEVFRMNGYNESDRVFSGFANTGLLSNINSPLSDGVYYYLITTHRTLRGQRVSALNKGYLILKR
ncbi:MAG: PKD-like domain-containing protein [Daejeonella sp.]|uniref:PKD-like domain-containing protein n=1 Tax=Daejeonella sp. TaxID=2805397 RepID=UPI002735E153|nr:PKD-like domain-containing protein [Daejeonella sp.]MDP3468597.1 PKD-like domain-containing protein [Daejeonella sp.]